MKVCDICGNVRPTMEYGWEPSTRHGAKTWRTCIACVDGRQLIPLFTVWHDGKQVRVAGKLRCIRYRRQPEIERGVLVCFLGERRSTMIPHAGQYELRRCPVWDIGEVVA